MLSANKMTNAKRSLREVLTTLKGRDNVAKNLLNLLLYLTGLEVLQFINTSKEINQLISVYLTGIISFPIQHLKYFIKDKSSLINESNLSNRCVRDYFMLKHLQHVSENDAKITFDKQSKIVQALTCTKVIVETKSSLQSPDYVHTWKKIHAANKKQTQAEFLPAIEKIKNTLNELKADDIDKKLNTLLDMVAYRTSVVVTFPSGRFTDLSSDRLLSYFHVKTRDDKKLDTFGSLSYCYSRLTSEILHFQKLNPEILMAMILDANTHPCYGTLQFNIQRLSGYGDSFFVFQPSIKKLAVASYGSGFGKERASYYAIDGVQSVAPLVADFSKEVIQACLNTDEKQEGVKNLSMKTSGEFIEVLYPSNIPLSDPRYIKHIHLAFNDKCSFKCINQLLSKGISVSVNNSPFENNEFCAAFYSNQLEKFYTDQALKHIEKALLHIGETTSEFLTVKFDYRTLQLLMKVKLNHHDFHQSQAAAILYLLGVNDYFKTTSAMKFLRNQKNTTLTYNLYLNGIARKEGKLTDQDAYTCELSSMQQLLNQLLKRIFSIALVSCQNEEYFKKFNCPHPITGKGATEESNQTKELYLGDEKQSYEIAVHWRYDTTIIEVIAKNNEFIDFVISTFNQLNLRCLKANNLICIDMPLAQILEKLQDGKYPYQATVVYEDKTGNIGDLWLAFRYGYATPGGYNCNPYHDMPDDEFGKLVPDFKLIENSKKIIGKTLQPKTFYTSLPSSCIASLQADPSEFTPGSLDRFSIYELGNLSQQKINTAAKMMRIPVEIYEKIFSKSLAMRPLPSIMIYLQDCEQSIRWTLRKLLSLTQDFTVNIIKTKESISFKNKIYWVPKSDFGKIEIKSSEKHIKLICDFFETEHVNVIIEKISTTCIRFCNVNPYQLLSILEVAPANLQVFTEKYFTDLIGNHSIEGESGVIILKHSVYLEGRSLIRKAEIISMAIQHNIRLDSFLGGQGVKCLNEFIVALNNDEQKSEIANANPLSLMQKTLLKEVIKHVCKLKHNWFDESLLYYAILYNLLPLVKFLIEKEHCNTRKISSSFSARHFSSDTRGKEVYEYICKVCPFYYRDYGLRFTFFKSSQGDIIGYENEIRSGDEIFDLDAADIVENKGYTLIPDAALEEELSNAVRGKKYSFVYSSRQEVELINTQDSSKNRLGFNTKVIV